METRFQIGDRIQSKSYSHLKGEIIRVVILESGHLRHQEAGYQVKDGRRRFVIADSECVKAA